MKKLFALLLSMIMAASLAAPAFAASVPAGDADPDGDILISPNPGDDWDFDWWTVEDEWASVCEEYPERIDIFLEEVEGWYAQHAGEYEWCDAGTFEEFVQNTGGKEAAYLSLFYEWNSQYEEKLARSELFTALGGVPGQVGVMVNGRYIQFPDAVPEIRNSRTMAPLRAVMETLGAEVEYNGNDDIRCTVNGVEYTFAVGSSAVNLRYVEYGGEGDAPDMEGLIMDCAPYIKDDRTYVPVRFIGEALGYEVDWDSEFQTAILVDREALAAEIDKDFTILNRARAANALTLKEGESGKADIKGAATLTMASLEGNKTYSANFSIAGLVNDQAVSGSAALDVSDTLAELLTAQGGMDGENGELVWTLLNALRKFEFIMNKDGGLWVHSDGLDSLAQRKNLWFSGSTDMGADVDVDLSAMFAGQDAASVGRAAAAVAGTGSVINWALVNQTMDMMALCSDDKFTTADGVSTLAIDLDGLMALYQDMGLGADDMKTAKDAFKQFSFTMKVDGEGGAAMTCNMETSAQSGVPGVKLAMDAVQSAGKAELTMDVNMAGMGQLQLTVTFSQEVSGEKPLTEPPADAVIIDNGAMPLNP